MVKQIFATAAVILLAAAIVVAVVCVASWPRFAPGSRVVVNKSTPVIFDEMDGNPSVASPGASGTVLEDQEGVSGTAVGP